MTKLHPAIIEAACGVLGYPPEDRARIAELEAQVEAFREALESINGFDVNANASMVNQVFRLKNIARDALMSALRKTEATNANKS